MVIGIPVMTLEINLKSVSFSPWSATPHPRGGWLDLELGSHTPSTSCALWYSLQNCPMHCVPDLPIHVETIAQEMAAWTEFVSAGTG